MFDANDFVSYRWEHIEKKRYYCVNLSKDLFGDIIITRAWGGINQASGRITYLPCASFEAGKKIIEQIAKTRLRRGYVVCNAST